MRLAQVWRRPWIFIKPPGQGVRVHGVSVPGGKQPPTILPAVTNREPLFRLPDAIVSQHIHHAGRQFDGALGLFVLGAFGDDPGAGNILAGSENLHQAFVKVYVPPFQAQ